MRSQRLLKRLGASALVGRIASFLIASYIRLVHRTSRWDYLGREHVDALLAEGRGVIIAFWHQRLLMGAAIRRETDARFFMLSSAHRDADIIADAVRPFGVEFIRGSAADPRKTFKNKGGGGALAQMISVLRDGHIVGLTPDGPRGPIGEIKPGIIRLAQLSGAPIVPAAYSTSRGRFLDVWDRFFLAFPFSRGCFVAGPPISVARDASPERLLDAAAELKQALNAAARLADASAGQSPDAAGLG